MKDYFVTKKFTIKRFGIEVLIVSIAIFLIYYYFFQQFDLITLFLSILFCYTLIAIIFFEKLLIPLQFIFTQLFLLIAKITNPTLITLCYILGIVPFGICYKLYTIFSKKKNVQDSYWSNVNISVKNIDMDEQY